MYLATFYSYIVAKQQYKKLDFNNYNYSQIQNARSHDKFLTLIHSECKAWIIWINHSSYTGTWVRPYSLPVVPAKCMQGDGLAVLSTIGTGFIFKQCVNFKIMAKCDSSEQILYMFTLIGVWPYSIIQYSSTIYSQGS